MTFLDSSAIIDSLGGVEDVIDYLDGREPFFTSTLCVYEVIDGKLGSGSLVVSDGDFQTDVLEPSLTVTNLPK